MLIWPRLLLQRRNAAVALLDAGISYPSRLLQVCLARILLKKPSVLFLDEATAAFDEKTEEHFQTVLEEQFVNCTIFCIAHRLEALRWCRMRLEMGKGRLMSLTSISVPGQAS